MTRRDAIQALYAATGTRTAIDLVEWLAARGLVSDLTVEPRDCATCDLVAAAKRLAEAQEIE